VYAKVPIKTTQALTQRISSEREPWSTILEATRSDTEARDTGIANTGDVRQHELNIVRMANIDIAYPGDRYASL
jgi:hypothetical protein